MIEVRKTEIFARWLDGLRDLQGRARVQARIERLALGNLGDVKPVGEGVSELRIDYGPGYWVYFKQRGRELIILPAGGDKSTQARDMKTAAGVPIHFLPLTSAAMGSVINHRRDQICDARNDYHKPTKPHGDQ